ncbi:hsp70 family protein [Anaeramoeba flamelloides]|uniref:Hsp70 family protein n=1 Tax=Anaeramoeba flamelloides TaxID=1746091 RepID=A0ABQ8Z0R6_9EUKA|nr:hsp70 family protein [Anaeramoeba flamelloides]
MSSNKMTNQKKINIICAIDFGTSRTGASWMLSVDNVSRNQIGSTDLFKVQLDSQVTNFKTKTTVLFKKKPNNNNYYSNNGEEWKPIFFGKEAENKYLKIQKKEPNFEDNYQLFKNFKMKLYNNDKINPKIKSKTGKEWEFIKVLSGVFQFIYKKFEESCEKHNSTLHYRIDSIQWVLTVPAIWEEKAKVIMRRAFYDAGLIKTQDSGNLLFCYEPEVAALDFLHDQRNQINDFHNKKLLVIDAGGGTIDITLIKPKIKMNEIKEFEILMVPKGGDFGSTYIDQQFLKFFQNFLDLNDDQFDQFQNQCIRGFLVLLDRWEDIKTGIQISEMTKKDIQLIEIPKIIFKYLKKTFGIKDFERLTEKYNKKNKKSGLSKIEWDDDDDCLCIYGDRIKSFFEKPIKKLSLYLKQLRQQTDIFKKTQMVIFTGGLSNSNYFRKSIKNLLGKKSYQYFLSPYPDKSIIIGAVLYGFDPDIVTIRRSHFTYGVKTMPIFNPQIHDQNRKIVIRKINNQEIEHCKNVFNPYIFTEDKIQLSTPIIKRFRTVRNSNEFKLEILRSTIAKWHPNQKSYYLDSPGVKLIGSLTIIFPQDNVPLNEKKVEVSFYFATTEIKIFMKYLPNPEIQKQLTLNYFENNL